jgi:inhibitor of KinA sporulation pathway (predicted exonuclease)
MPILDLVLDPALSAWPQQGRIGILDLEFTAWDGSWKRAWSEPWEWREIVQVGLLSVDASLAFAPLEGVETLVKPQRNPELSNYFQSLTGITQDRLVREGRSLFEAMADMQALMSGIDMVIFNGYDGQILRENCVLLGCEFPWPHVPAYNFRPLLSSVLNHPSEELVSSALPILAGVENIGQAHTALDDCRAIAAALGKWRSSAVL